MTVSAGLADAFQSAGTDAGVRFLKAQIRDETIDFVESVQAQSDFESDFDLVTAHLDKDKASYLLYKSDKTNAQVFFVGFNPREMSGFCCFMSPILSRSRRRWCTPPAFPPSKILWDPTILSMK